MPGDIGLRGRRSIDLAATFDLVVEEVQTCFCGAVVACDKQYVTLEDRHRARPADRGGRRRAPRRRGRPAGRGTGADWKHGVIAAIGWDLEPREAGAAFSVWSAPAGTGTVAVMVRGAAHRLRDRARRGVTDRWVS